MIPAARKESIRNVIENYGFVSAGELARQLGISLSTVRRDLIELENEGVIVRTRGGAGINGHNLVLSPAAVSRAIQHTGEKSRIAEKAVELVADAGCIVLDAGTTTLEVARRLYPRQPLKVITDSIEIAYELKDREHITILITGGILHPSSYFLYGGFGEEMLGKMHAQVCVMGAVGLSLKQGLTKHDIEALQIRKRMIDISHKLICVADSSKMNVTGLVSICPADRVDILITDTGINPEFKKALEATGCQILTV